MLHQAICAGSFDPPTDGHINIVSRGLKMFDKVIVAVAMNTSKDTLFTVHERVEMLREIFADYQNVEIDAFEGLLVEYAKKRGVHTILRGLRTIGDYDYESQMALANKTLDPDIEFLYMMTEGKYAHISSSVIKEVIRFGGSGCGMIHPLVARRLKEKLLRKGS
ncbi:MAG TPA: pantetheine-phosphate adenylyltransferase [bacterium]|nr:MAG: Phosphopantetheine adenylyltransferase [bacterium ADurb.Bin270]HPW44826.1 pantetheine-phosphate adenylyltransferase [bacterium]HQG12821.1 pantetheine-phosphate adenylyltransferase [bacterium]HQH80033.1 pantetheine-phosphate adenylyltransferase [bacterium]